MSSIGTQGYQLDGYTINQSNYRAVRTGLADLLKTFAEIGGETNGVTTKPKPAELAKEYFGLDETTYWNAVKQYERENHGAGFGPGVTSYENQAAFLMQMDLESDNVLDGKWDAAKVKTIATEDAQKYAISQGWVADPKKAATPTPTPATPTPNKPAPAPNANAPVQGNNAGDACNPKAFLTELKAWKADPANKQYIKPEGAISSNYTLSKDGFKAFITEYQAKYPNASLTEVDIAKSLGLTVGQSTDLAFQFICNQRDKDGRWGNNANGISDYDLDEMMNNKLLKMPAGSANATPAAPTPPAAKPQPSQPPSGTYFTFDASTGLHASAGGVDVFDAQAAASLNQQDKIEVVETALVKTGHGLDTTKIANKLGLNPNDFYNYVVRINGGSKTITNKVIAKALLDLNVHFIAGDAADYIGKASAAQKKANGGSASGNKASAASKQYKVEGCAPTIDPSAKANVTQRTAWEKTQAAAGDMNVVVPANTTADHVVTVKSGMTLSLIAKSVLHGKQIDPGHADYKKELKKLTDALVTANGCSTKIDIDQTIDLKTITAFADYIK